MTRRISGPTGSPIAERSAQPSAAPEAALWRRTLLGGLWIAVLIAVIVVLGRLGQGQLSTPPLLDRPELRAWLDERDAIVAAFALVRLIGLALAWYLLIVTSVGLVARVSRVPALVRMADAATVPAVRKVLGAVAGVGITASAASLTAAHLIQDQPPAEVAGPGAMADHQIVLSRLPGGDEVVLRRLAEGEEGTSTMRLEDETAPAEEQAATEWVAEPGDHLWHIAEATLADAWGRAPTDAELIPYWQGLIDANRDVLADPDNPDLIHPGQRFALPTPPPPPAAAQP